METPSGQVTKDSVGFAQVTAWGSSEPTAVSSALCASLQVSAKLALTALHSASVWPSARAPGSAAAASATAASRAAIPAAF